MGDIHQLQQRVIETWPPVRWRDVAVVVAVSGGADSVALLRALTKIDQGQAGRLSVAHYNHRLRGEESEGDEWFVRQLGAQLGLRVEVGHAPTTEGVESDNREAPLRRQRYRFLRTVADRLAARYIVTAHTADDQAETVLHRILRGTGLSGLSGIPVTRRLSELTTIVRPLLTVSRASVLDYLAQLRQSFREDSSNRRMMFTRNRIRHGLLPELASQYNPRVSEALVRLSQLASAAQDEILSHVETLAQRCVTCCGAEHVQLDRSVLAEQSPFMVCELMKEVWRRQHWPQQAMGDDKWRQLGRMVHDEKPGCAAVTLPGEIQVTVRADLLELRRGAPPSRASQTS